MRAIVLLALITLGLGCSQGDRETEPAAANAGVQPDAASSAADEEALRAADQRALVAFRSADAATMDALYAENAVLVNPGAEPLEGRAAIDALHREEMSRPGYVVEWEPIRVEAAESGDLGFVYGRWSARSDKDPESSDQGYYVNVYRKIDGVWRTTVEVNGSSTPVIP